MAQREFTGRHAAILFIGAFGVIITVNIALAVSAVRTFPGLEVANSYVASQQFDARRTAQQALGWTAAAGYDGERLTLAINTEGGVPADLAALRATVGRPTEAKDDFNPDFAFDGATWTAAADLAPGQWYLRLTATAADGTEFAQRLPITVAK